MSNLQILSQHVSLRIMPPHVDGRSIIEGRRPLLRLITTLVDQVRLGIAPLELIPKMLDRQGRATQVIRLKLATSRACRSDYGWEGGLSSLPFAVVCCPFSLSPLCLEAARHLWKRRWLERGRGRGRTRGAVEFVLAASLISLFFATCHRWFDTFSNYLSLPGLRAHSSIQLWPMCCNCRSQQLFLLLSPTGTQRGQLFSS